MRLACTAIEHARRLGYLHLAYHIQHPRIDRSKGGMCRFCIKA